MTLVVLACAGTAIMVALIFILGTANRQRDRALELQAHSYDLMVLARTLSGTIARSEASLGRYVISGDNEQGQLYFDEWTLANAQINRLDQLTEDKSRQGLALRRLRKAYTDRGEELSLIALSTRYGKNNQALSRYYQSRRGPALAQIDKTLDRMIAREKRLLDSRTGLAMRTVERSNQWAGILAVFGILIVLGAIVLGWFIVKTVNERAMALAEADQAYERAAELSAAVTDATDALREQEAKLRQVQKMEAVGQLTGGIAHDFNNMLSVVLGGLELAKRAMPSELGNARRHVDSAMEGANRAAALTRRLLAFSREDSLRPELIVVASMVDGMSELLDRTLGDGITLDAHDEARGWQVRADRVQLENALLNLAVNARDAMDGRGVLRVVTNRKRLRQNEIGHCKSGDYVTIAVTDTGCGMSPEIAERVFEPFFTTKPVGKGTGLGLSQSFAFVRQLDGEIGIDTALGKGTTVTLYLPRNASAPVDRTLTIVDEMRAVKSAALRIMIVEDDPRVLAATTEALEELGHHVVACDDPLVAPSVLARESPIDLLISDVLMPRQSGPEMVAELVRQFPYLAVLFVTGFAGEASTSEFGDRPVLRKPFTIAALERAIAIALDSAPIPGAQVAAE